MGVSPMIGRKRHGRDGSASTGKMPVVRANPVGVGEMARTMKKTAPKKTTRTAKKAAARPKDLRNRKIAAPRLPYLPRDPKSYRPNIGLIACGGITASHLRAYKKAGYKVVALCDLIEQRAQDRRKEFYPKADVYTDYRDVLAREDIEVVDIATHPKDREELL